MPSVLGLAQPRRDSSSFSSLVALIGFHFFSHWHRPLWKCLTTSDWAPGPTYIYIYIYGLSSLSPLQLLLEILRSDSSGGKEDVDVMIVPLRPIFIASDCTDFIIYYYFFIIDQVTLLTFQYTRRAFIKLLRLYVPHVPRCDENPTAEHFIGN